MTWIFPESERLESPSRYPGRKHRSLPKPPPVDTIVIHYAVDGDQRADGDSLPESKNFEARHRRDDCMDVARAFAKPKRQASAHFVIGRDGSKVQCVDTDDAAWHAGDGRMHPDGIGTLGEMQAKTDIPRLVNLRSVGFELCNVGWAVDRFDIPADERVTFKHPAQREEREWEAYAKPLLDTFQYVLSQLVLAHPGRFKYVLGHEDVTNRHTLGRFGGKTDPGPFPWDAIDWFGIRRVEYDFKAQVWDYAGVYDA